MKILPPPLIYNTTAHTSRQTIEVKFIIGEDETEKEKLPIYHGQSEEALLILVKEYKSLVKEYDLFEIRPQSVFQNFRKCLREHFKDNWDEILTTMDENGDERNQELFDAGIKAFLEEHLGDQPGIRQKHYLRRTLSHVR